MRERARQGTRRTSKMQSATLVFCMSCTLSFRICRGGALRRAELRNNSWSAADRAAPNGNSSLREQTREPKNWQLGEEPQP